MSEDKKFKWSDLSGIVKDSFKDWNNDDAFTHAAAVSYYAIFSLPAFLIIIINVLGTILGKESVQGNLSQVIGKSIGQDTAKQIGDMINSATSHSNSTLMIVIGVCILIVSATGFFMQLQKALNRMWEVKVRDDVGFLHLLFDRVRTVGILLGMCFLILLSITITGILSGVREWILSMLPDFTIYLFYGINFLISFIIISLLFALIFKYLPDVRIPFKSVWVGAVVTAFLFMVGQYGLTLYFSLANPASAYGVAGSFILILLWVYYSCLLLFFGAEFTQTFAQKYDHKIEPSRSAIKVEPCVPVEPHSYGTK